MLFIGLPVPINMKSTAASTSLMFHACLSRGHWRSRMTAPQTGPETHMFLDKFRCPETSNLWDYRMNTVECEGIYHPIEHAIDRMDPNVTVFFMGDSTLYQTWRVIQSYKRETEVFSAFYCAMGVIPQTEEGFEHEMDACVRLHTNITDRQHVFVLNPSLWYSSESWCETSPPRDSIACNSCSGAKLTRDDQKYPSRVVLPDGCASSTKGSPYSILRSVIGSANIHDNLDIDSFHACRAASRFRRSHKQTTKKTTIVWVGSVPQHYLENGVGGVVFHSGNGTHSKCIERVQSVESIRDVIVKKNADMHGIPFLELWKPLMERGAFHPIKDCTHLCEPGPELRFMGSAILSFVMLYLV